MTQEKPPSGSFTERLIKSGGSPVHFILCRDRQGHIAHYFLKTTQDKLRLLKDKKEDVDPGDYGAVLASGFGYMPTEATKRMLLAEHAYDFNRVCADYIREYAAKSQPQG